MADNTSGTRQARRTEQVHLDRQRQKVAGILEGYQERAVLCGRAVSFFMAFIDLKRGTRVDLGKIVGSENDVYTMHTTNQLAHQRSKLRSDLIQGRARSQSAAKRPLQGFRIYKARTANQEAQNVVPMKLPVIEFEELTVHLADNDVGIRYINPDAALEAAEVISTEYQRIRENPAVIGQFALGTDLRAIE